MTSTPETHTIHTLIRITIHGVNHVSCTRCPLVVRQPSGMPDYGKATMSTWNRGNTP